MEIQKGDAVRMFAGEDIEEIIDANGVGKALVYAVGDEEVLEGQEGLGQYFAGITSTVSAEATVSRTNQNVNMGAVNVAEGDAVGVLKDHMVPVKVSGAVPYASFLTLDDDGEFKALALSATPTTHEILSICGRAYEGIDKAGVIVAKIWARK